jgi:hypothetical protein
MGVDYYNCSKCGEIYNDCEGFYDNCEKCEERICYYCQVELNMRTEVKYFSKGAEPIGDYWEDDRWTDKNRVTYISHILKSCPYCKKEIISDEMVLEYLLKKINMTIEEIKDEIKNSDL